MKNIFLIIILITTQSIFAASYNKPSASKLYKEAVELVKKEFFNKNDMNKLKIDETETKADHSKKSFVYNFFYTLRQRIDDPRGIKRSKN